MRMRNVTQNKNHICFNALLAEALNGDRILLAKIPFLFKDGDLIKIDERASLRSAP